VSSVLLPLAPLLMSTCCPDPRPIADGAGGADGSTGGSARLSVIQKQVFDGTGRCVTDCHEGGSAAADLRLNKGKSYQSLVNVASKQIASQVRVIPADADDSYLVRKLEGGPGIVGKQMPHQLPPLAQADIDLVRSWITRGASDD